MDSAMIDEVLLGYVMRSDIWKCEYFESILELRSICFDRFP